MNKRKVNFNLIFEGYSQNLNTYILDENSRFILNAFSESIQLTYYISCFDTFFKMHFK